MVTWSCEEPFTAADGGKDRSCRGAKAWDDSPEHYREVQLFGATLAKCKALCVGSPGCKGIEFQPSGTCLIFTRPGGIDATAERPGHVCLRYGATQAGAKEQGKRVGQIHLAKQPELCLDFEAIADGTPMRVWPCVNSTTRFVLGTDATAQIRLSEAPEKCVEVLGGLRSAADAHSDRLRLWCDMWRRLARIIYPLWSSTRCGLLILHTVLYA